MRKFGEQEHFVSTVWAWMSLFKKLVSTWNIQVLKILSSFPKAYYINQWSLSFIFIYICLINSPFNFLLLWADAAIKWQMTTFQTHVGCDIIRHDQPNLKSSMINSLVNIKHVIYQWIYFSIMSCLILKQETWTELSQNETSTLQRSLWNQRKDR